MIFTVRPADFLNGTVNLPASKSYSIRAFLIAALGGRSKIISPSDCEDAKVARKIAQQLGATIKLSSKNSFNVKGSRGKLKNSKVNVEESGTVLRFLLPVLASRNGKFVVIGEGTLRGRPNFYLNQTLRKMGVAIRGRGPRESVPIRIHGGNLRGGNVVIDGSLSSQFISALLITCPSLGENTKLTIKGKRLVSETYITMTHQILRRAGIKIKRLNQRSFFIKGKQKFKGIGSFKVPSDYGLAAFFLVAAALIKSKVTLKGNLNDSLAQADRAIIPFLHEMGVKFSKTKNFLEIKGPQNLKGGDFSLKDAPDLVPIMAVAALFAQGKTRLYNIRHVRAKESDRISDLHHELKKIGAKITEKQNEIIIHPCSNYKKNIFLDPQDDHRLAMAFSILGLKIGARIKNIRCTSKSYPQFIKDLRSLGVSTSVR